MSKFIIKTMFAALILVGFASCSKDDENTEPAASERFISVQVYESITPATDEWYKPSPWSGYNVMLFSVPATDVAGTQSQLSSGILELSNGSTCKPAYSSSIGYIQGAAFGTYTLLVYCSGSITNGYMQGRYSYKQLVYSADNYQYTDNCVFVWGDMNTKGGFYPWSTK